MKSPPEKDAAQLLPPSRITGIFHCVPVLVQEESTLVHGQLIKDPLRVERILALGRLSTHGVIVTRWEGHGPRHVGLRNRRVCYGSAGTRLMYGPAAAGAAWRCYALSSGRPGVPLLPPE
jgi:hypothetical protein